jgi:small subunit ribosomal protein S14
MAKQSKIEHNRFRELSVERWKVKRLALKLSRSASVEENFSRSMKIACLPRNGCEVRRRLRCELTGRPRGVYKKFMLCRIAFRDLVVRGEIPGVRKASW